MQNKSKESFTYQNEVVEINFISNKKYGDPFSEIEMDVIFDNQQGKKLTIPAFWAGGDQWKVRYSSPTEGSYKFITKCSDLNNSGLHNIKGMVNISKYTGDNLLIKHGPIKVSSNELYLEHLDGTPFFWLADTWWSALTRRFKWPDLFKIMTKDRRDKGFSVVQITAGLLPRFDKNSYEYQKNEGGSIWDKDFKRINPHYFDYADLKIDWLIRSGIVPCIFGSWGYYLQWLGIEKMKKYWRYIIARWGAYPIIWCTAGEATMPYYSTNGPEREKSIKKLQKEWGEVVGYIKYIDPYKRMITIHPSPGSGSWSSRDTLKDSKLFDFDMLQTSNRDRNFLGTSLEKLQKSLNSKPRKPVINGEVCYEGSFGTYWQETQRFLFWTHILSGAAGHSYGAEGIWEFSTGDYADVAGWTGETLWSEAMNFLGSYQIGLGKKFLESFKWNKFEPHPEWVSPYWTEDKRTLLYCAGIPGKVRIIYIPSAYLYLSEIFELKEITIKGIEKNIDYNAYYFNPRTGITSEEMIVKPDQYGNWVLSAGVMHSPCPSLKDWVLVLERRISK